MIWEIVSYDEFDNILHTSITYNKTDAFTAYAIDSLNPDLYNIYLFKVYKNNNKCVIQTDKYNIH